jgi:glycosyltransferase involved in cell wall biosynthesis
MVKVSVIIPALNEEECIEQTLKSVVKQKIPRKDYEVIVSDGKSKDKTVRIAKKYADKVFSKKNKSISEARNLGARKAKGEYLIFIDADTRILPTLLSKVIKAMSDKKVAGGIVRYGYDTRSIIMKVGNTLHYFLNVFFNNFIPSLLMASGVCLFFRRKSFNKIKGFDQTLHLNEDVDVIRRVRREGRVLLLNERVYSSDRRLRQMGAVRFLIYSVSSFFKYQLLRKRFKGKYVKTDGL